MITVHKCWSEQTGVFYFKKETYMICSRCCRGATMEIKPYDLYLEEDTVDKMNIEIFDNIRFNHEVENDPLEFFNPTKHVDVIDTSTKSYRNKYKSSKY